MADLHHGGEVPGEGAAGVLNVQGELGGAHLKLPPVHLLHRGLGIIEQSTNLLEVSQCLEKAPTRASPC